ncbi:U-box domain-containing protein 33 isoform X2 [Arachis stenosperma]|uniref:U-box domain-containing protein 33 isoform X2 n=1 Tax=Arachis stenosperma TaxID=217475 RepID=UPI0025ABEFCA|nr:U-box domain-containing protein 33 isoform X2 [Arachis stenosperma]
MAVVSPVPATTQRMGSVRRVQEGEIVEEPNQAVVVDEPIYVAVSKEVKESKLNLIWAIQNSGGRRICILHVHVPATMIPLMGAKFPASSLKEQEVRAYWDIERQTMHKTLDEYLRICQRMGVQAEKVPFEMDNIEKGIVELVSQRGIQRLVMGAASDRSHSRRMMDLKSKKAIFVCEQAPAFCRIQFICKGHLIHTRDRTLGEDNLVASPLAQQVPNSEAEHPVLPRSQSVITPGQNQTSHRRELFRKVRSANDGAVGGIMHDSSPDNFEGFSTPPNRLGTDLSSDESDRLSRTRSPSALSVCSDSGAVDPMLSPNSVSEIAENVAELTLSHAIKEDLHSSPPSVLDGGMNDTIYDQLELAMAEAERATRNAYQETYRRGKAEKEAIEAMRKAKISESLYVEELNLRKRAEEELQKEKEQLQNMKIQRDKVKEELQLALDQKSSLESQIASSELMIKEYEQKIISAVDLLQSYKNERDELQVQRDEVLREATELRKKQGEASGTRTPQLFSEFSFLEIEQATNNFDQSLKIGEGGYGSIFKGMLRHTEVAIKMLHSDSMQGPLEFQQEVDVLSKLRHPNLITLVGACPESFTLIYEYLPNGSLEDRLVCKDNTPPLPWQTRIRIAAELCSALIFLHSSKPHRIVHGDLKPSNILLDANLISKLSDFGICRILSRREDSTDNTTECWRTHPKGTFVYMDPEFLASGELTPKSDVYSFGIILMRLLTGRPALGITKEVSYALETGKLKSLLDPLAGDWPFVQAEQLARLAMRCCEMNRKNRPDLYSDVWRVLDPMTASSGGTLSPSGLYQQTPSYFICPIFQEVMRDPHVAADGFTYEAEAIRGWLDSGHDDSPMTNSKLAHRNLVPNRALKSAIHDWLQSH